MKMRTNPILKIKNAAMRATAYACLLSGTTMLAGTVRTWTGAGADNYLGDANNWSPSGVPSASANDILQWNGSQAGNLVLTNGLSGFDSNPGFNLIVTAAQTGSVTLVDSNTATGRIRLNGTNTLTVPSGAGAFSFGNGGTQLLPIALAGKGTGEIHNCTNNSANTVTFNTETYYVMGGGGAHTLLLSGTGNWQVDSSLQAQNSGSSLALAVNGSCTVNLIGAAASGVAYAGNYGNVTLNSGTLQLAAAGAIGTGNTLVLAGGTLDSTVANLVNSGNNPQNWNGNFTFHGTQNLNLGLGPVTMNASRIVTVSANTLTVGGGIAGTGFSLTKSGAGTLALGGGDTYTGGTVVSNGVLQLQNSGAIPSGSAAAEAVTIYGTLDLNGNPATISSLNGTGVVDTVSGGSPTLTVGDQAANGGFNGHIQNTSGSLSLVQSGGALTLGGASTYSGGTTINAGVLLVTNTTGSATGSGAVSVASGATFGGPGAVGGAVTWQAGALGTFTEGTPLAVGGSVTLNGNAITVNVPGATPLGVGNYTLMTYNNSGSSGSFAGSSPTFTGAGVAAGTTIAVTNGNGVVSLVVDSSTSGVTSTWTNNGNGNWSAAANWSSNPQIPQKAGDAATLGAGSAYTTVTLDTAITNAAVTFTNANSFTIANAGNTFTFDNTNGGAALIASAGASNSITAPISLNDNLSVSVFSGASLSIPSAITSTSPSLGMSVGGAGTLSLAGNNTYGPAAGSVGTAITGTGTLQLGNNNALGAGDVSVLNNGTIGAGTALNVPNNIIISNTVTASVNDNGNNFTLAGVISGGGALGKNGAGTLVLSGANTYNGTTSISAGKLQLGNASGIPGGNGNGNVNMGTNTTLDLNGFSPVLNAINSSFSSATIDNVSAGGAASLTLGESGAFGTFSGSIKNTSGSVALVKDGAGTESLTGTNFYTGGTTITGGTLSVGNGNTNASAGLGTGPVVDNATLQFNLVGTNAFTNAISGSGLLNLANSGLTLVLATSNSFTGNINTGNSAGSLWLKSAAALGPGPKQVHLENGSAGNTQMHLDGGAGNITTDSGIDFYLSNVAGTIFNESGSNTINGNIYMPFGGGNPYVIVKSGFLTLSGTVQDGGTFNNSRTLMLGGPGNGLFSGSAIDNAVIIGGVSKVDSGTWTVSGVNTTVGSLTVNAGTLVLSGQWSNGPVVVSSPGTLTGGGSASNLTVNAGGSFVPGAYGSIGTFTVVSNMTWSGTMYAAVNKSLVQSNTLVNVGLATANSGGTLIVSNLGPALVAGDTFTFFSQGVTNGNVVNVVVPSLPAGLSVTNNLAVNGSISLVASVATNPTNITATVSGGQLTLSWPADHTGWYLQSQTNTLGNGLGTNWVDVAGSSTTNRIVIPINAANGAVFYRMSLNP